MSSSALGATNLYTAEPRLLKHFRQELISHNHTLKVSLVWSNVILSITEAEYVVWRSRSLCYPELVTTLSIFPWLFRRNRRGYVAPHSCQLTGSLQPYLHSRRRRMEGCFPHQIVLTSFKLCSRTLRIFNLNSNFHNFYLMMRLQGPKYQL